MALNTVWTRAAQCFNSEKNNRDGRDEKITAARAREQYARGAELLGVRPTDFSRGSNDSASERQSGTERA
jgi:hypothetical protein